MSKKYQEKQIDKQRWQRRKKSRPEEITAAALELFVERGFSATKLDDVAKLAGISKGTLYLYFKSKETLFRAVVNEIVIPEVERAEHTVEGYAGDITTLLHQLINNWWTTVGESRLCGIPKLMVSEAGNFPELAKFYVDEVIGRVRELIASTIQKGIESGEFKQCDPEYATRLLIAPVVFAAIWKQSLQPFDSAPYNVQEYLDTHLDLFFNGIRSTTKM